jgi:hypothetical protein
MVSSFFKWGNYPVLDLGSREAEPICHISTSINLYQERKGEREREKKREREREERGIFF